MKNAFLSSYLLQAEKETSNEREFISRVYDLAEKDGVRLTTEDKAVIADRAWELFGRGSRG